MDALLPYAFSTVETVLKPFGRYFLLDRITQGGMAEVFRGRPDSVDSGSRLLAIKCLRANLIQEKQFMDMFRAEVRITVGLSHPNIVQHYDYGDGQETFLNDEPRPFLAMEYIHGISLRALYKHHRNHVLVPRLDILVSILEQVARGLHYAHEFRDPISQMPLNIVHRDINPANVLISYDGDVKVIDFGVAKAAVMGEATASGLIKGTPAYLSPEQVMASRDIDRRSDVFALGILLWEGLTGRKLFNAQDDREMLVKIEKCDEHVVAPSVVTPMLPRALDEVALKALSHDPAKRYQTADEFRQALLKAAQVPSIDETRVGPGKAIRHYLLQYFQKEEREALANIRQLNAEAERLIIEQMETEAERNEAEAESGDFGVPDLSLPSYSQSSQHVGTKHIKLLEPTVQSESISRPSNPISGSTSRGKEIELKTADIIAPLSLERTIPRGPKPGVRRGRRPHSDREPPTNHRFVAPSQTQGGFFGFLMMLTVAGVVGYMVFSHLAPSIGVPPEVKVVEVPVEGESGPPPGFARVLMAITPSGGGTKVKLNGKYVPPAFPLTRLDIDVNTKSHLIVSRMDFESWEGDISVDTIPKDDQGQQIFSVTLIPAKFGLLSITTTVSGEARMTIGHEEWVRPTPVETEKIPPGSYKLHLRNSVMGVEKILDITIEKGRLLRINEDLSRPSH